MVIRGSDYFEKYDKKVDELYDAGKYAEAIIFMEPAWSEFPERFFDITCFVMRCHRELGQFYKCLELIENGVRRGFFFTLQWEGWDPIRKVEGSGAILAENERLKAEAEKSAQMQYEVHLPDGYTPEKRWPLLLTMHCDSGFIGNIEGHRRYWKPDASLKRGFITVYVQSSHVLSSKGFEWSSDVEQRRVDIRQCCDAVTANYAVDTGMIIVSGFSGGALASIDIALNAVIPVRGFIALGPDKPKDFSREKCQDSHQKGIRGVIMEGELSEGESVMWEMVAIFKQVGFPYKLIINEGIGHWYPDDLTEKLDTAIAFIMDA